MILIKKNTVNTVILTLSEKTTLDPVFYLFEFIQQGSPGTKKIFLASDISSNKPRYNEFEIEETTSEDLINGKIDVLTGDWFYNIYEQSSSSNLDPTLAGEIVEFGRVEVEEGKIALSAFNEQPKIITGFRE